MYGRRNFERTGRVPVNANGLRDEGNNAAVSRDHAALFHNPQRLFCCLLWVTQQGIFELPRAKTAIPFIAAVGKSLSGHRKSHRAELFQHYGACQPNKDDIRFPAARALGNRAGYLTISRRLVVQRAMGFHMTNLRATLLGNFRQGENLLVNGR